MNLVVGATGLLGDEICHQLTQQGKIVRALVRETSDPVKVNKLKEYGCELVYGDMKNPSSLDKAFYGASTVISTASCTFSRQEDDSIQTVDLEGQLNVVHTAANAGVKHFIFISFVKDPSFPFPLSDAKLKVEEHIKKSGVNYTILEANFFMEVWLSEALGFDAANGKARIYGDGTSKISWVSYLDVTKFAVAMAGNEAAKNRVFKIGGSEALSPLEVIKIFEEMTGNPFSVELVPVQSLQSQKKNAPDPLQESFVALMLGYALGNQMDMEPVLKEFPIDMKTMRDYATDFVKLAKE